MLLAIYNFWNTYGSDFQSGAVVLSAIAAFWVISAHRQNAKKRNTLDLILHHESDSDLIVERQKFNDLKAGTTKLATYGKPTKKNSEQAQSIRKVLNLHELTAVAMEEGVIDERVFRRWFNHTIITDYEATEAYISEARKTYGNPKAFCEFERMALRWKNDRSWYDQPGWWSRKKDAAVSLIKA